MKNASLLSLLCLMTASILQCYKIDPETVPRSTIRRRDQAVLDLVMSDEFSLEGRSFAKGDDSVFEAQERPDDINQAISFCKLHFSRVLLDATLFIFCWIQYNGDASDI
jgi:hypothetical protein